MATKRRYDDKFRASAVVMLEAAGYPGRLGALAQVSQRLKVPETTLHGWARATRNPPPAELRTEKRGELIDWIRAELSGIFEAMPGARPDASYRDLGTVAGILTDKLQLLTGNPTNIHGGAIEVKGIDYRASIAALAPGPMGDSDPPSEG